MSLNAFDYMILLIAVLSGWSGFHKGFLYTVGSMVSLAVGILLSIIYYRDLASYLQDYYGLTAALAESIRSNIPLTALKIDQDLSIHGLILGDSANYLAYLLVIALSFITIFLVSSKLTQLLWLGIENIFTLGCLSSINRGLGIVLVVSRNFIILSITLGLLYPALLLSSKMGFYLMLAVVDSIDKSLIASYMLQTYELLKAWTGMS